MKYIPVKRVQLIREGTLKVEAKKISGSSEACRVFKQFYDELAEPREVFSVAYLDTKNVVIGIQVITKGVLDSSLVHPREVFQGAILANASSIIVAHNHPSGDTKPSREDIAVTGRLIEAGKVVGIDVLDHVIVGDTALSLQESVDWPA